MTGRAKGKEGVTLGEGGEAAIGASTREKKGDR